MLRGKAKHKFQSAGFKASLLIEPNERSYSIQQAVRCSRSQGYMPTHMTLLLMSEPAGQSLVRLGGTRD